MADKKYYCYILRNKHLVDINRTYNGKTNDPMRRLNEHNQVKSKTRGAMYTRKWGNKTWEFISLITGFSSEKEALRCEWRIKKPEGKTRSTKYNSPGGRIKGLDYALNLEKFTSNCEKKIKDQELTIWILKEYRHLLQDRPEYKHLKIIECDTIDKDTIDQDTIDKDTIDQDMIDQDMIDQDTIEKTDTITHKELCESSI